MTQAQASSITTLTVSIKAVQVGNKAMTIAVYKQIPEEDYLDYERASVTGQAWGWINYCLPSCNDIYPPEHKHLLWIHPSGTLYKTLWYGQLNKVVRGNITRFYHTMLLDPSLGRSEADKWANKIDDIIVHLRSLPQIYIAV